MTMQCVDSGMGRAYKDQALSDNVAQCPDFLKVESAVLKIGPPNTFANHAEVEELQIDRDQKMKIGLISTYDPHAQRGLISPHSKGFH
jgi:hypothetical protein